jgi:hypothetical protein
MKSYRPGQIPEDPKQLAAFLRRELGNIYAASLREDPFMELEVLYASPSKVRAGMVVYADGTTWNPGSGEGVYRRDKANAAWVHLG